MSRTDEVEFEYLIRYTYRGYPTRIGPLDEEGARDRYARYTGPDVRLVNGKRLVDDVRVFRRPKSVEWEQVEFE